MDSKELINKGFTKHQAEAIKNGSAQRLSQEIAYSSGSVEDFNRYFGIKKLGENVVNAELDRYIEDESDNTLTRL